MIVILGQNFNGKINKKELKNMNNEEKKDELKQVKTEWTLLPTIYDELPPAQFLEEFLKHYNCTDEFIVMQLDSVSMSGGRLPQPDTLANDLKYMKSGHQTMPKQCDFIADIYAKQINEYYKKHPEIKKTIVDKITITEVDRKKAEMDYKIKLAKLESEIEKSEGWQKTINSLLELYGESLGGSIAQLSNRSSLVVFSEEDVQLAERYATALQGIVKSKKELAEMNKR